METSRQWLHIFLTLTLYGACLTQGPAQPCPHYEQCTCFNNGPDYVMECKNTDLTTLPPIIRTANIIRISGNRFDVVRPDRFVEATAATEITLENNNVITVDVGAFPAANEALTTLSISRNRIEELPARVFQNLVNLETLELQANNLGSLVADHFLGLGKLRTLNLANNRLKELTEDVFVHLISLRILHLEDNSISFIPQTTFSPLIALEEFHASENSLTAMPDIRTNVDLKVLALARNLIASVDAEPLHNLTRLTSLDLTGNWFNCDCTMLPFRNWTILTTTVSFPNTQVGGNCHTPSELANVFFLTTTLDQLTCPTTTTTTTTPLPTTTTPTTTAPPTQPLTTPRTGGLGEGLSDSTLGIIIGCSVGGFVLIVIILIAVCTALVSKSQTRRRDIRYILKTGSSSASDSSRERLPEVGDIFTVSGGGGKPGEKPPITVVSNGSARFSRGPPEGESATVGLDRGSGRVPPNSTASLGRHGHPTNMASMDMLPPKYEEYDQEGTLPRTPNKMNGLLQYAYTKDNERRLDSRSKSFNYGAPKTQYRDPNADVLNFYNLSPGPKRQHRVGNLIRGGNHSSSPSRLHPHRRGEPAIVTYASSSESSSCPSPYDKYGVASGSRGDITKHGAAPSPSNSSQSGPLNVAESHPGPAHRFLSAGGPTQQHHSDSADSGVASPHGSITAQGPLVSHNPAAPSASYYYPKSQMATANTHNTPIRHASTVGMEQRPSPAIGRSPLTAAIVGTPPKKPKSETYV